MFCFDWLIFLVFNVGSLKDLWYNIMIFIVLFYVSDVDKEKWKILKSNLIIIFSWFYCI